jgi:hypothetical protein
LHIIPLDLREKLGAATIFERAALVRNWEAMKLIIEAGGAVGASVTFKEDEIERFFDLLKSSQTSLLTGLKINSIPVECLKGLKKHVINHLEALKKYPDRNDQVLLHLKHAFEWIQFLNLMPKQSQFIRAQAEKKVITK